jgi:hypothetical protein
VPLPGGLGGLEGGVLGALALTGTHPATALTAVIIYRVAGYWAPGAAGAVTAAFLTRCHPARAARPVTPLRPQAPPPPAPGQPPSPQQAASAALPALARHPHLPRRAPLPRPPVAGPPAGEPRAAAGRPTPPTTGSPSSLASPVSCTPLLAVGRSPNRAARRRGALPRAAADARAARPWSVPGRPARPGLKLASAHPTAGPSQQDAADSGRPRGQRPVTARSRGDWFRSPARLLPAPLPARHERHGRDGHRPPTERKGKMS